MTDEHKEDDSIKGELGEVIRVFRHVFERRTLTGSGLFFLNFGQCFCPKGQFGEFVCGYWCLKV